MEPPFHDRKNHKNYSIGKQGYYFFFTPILRFHNHLTHFSGESKIS